MQFIRFFLLTSTVTLLLGLQLAWARIDTLRTFPEKRFVNGVMNLAQYIAKNLRYPLQAQQAAIIGTSLVSLTITPTGELINVTIVNSLGKAIDSEVRRLIESTGKMWMPADQSASQDSILLVLPILFSLNEIKFYVEPVKPDFVLSAIIVVGINRAVTTIKEDAYYVTQLTTASGKKDYKQMLKMVNELIRRNPYSDKLYFQRANIERELGLTEEACGDYRKIIYFLGKTHFPKHFIQNCS